MTIVLNEQSIKEMGLLLTRSATTKICEGCYEAMIQRRSIVLLSTRCRLSMSFVFFGTAAHSEALVLELEHCFKTPSAID